MYFRRKKNYEKNATDLPEELISQISAGVNDTKEYGRIIHNPTELECVRCGTMCPLCDTQEMSWGKIYSFRCYSCMIQFHTIEGKSSAWIDRGLNDYADD